MRLTTLRCVLAAVAAAAVGAFATAAADPLKTTGGKAVLPMTGLVIDLPPQAGVTYNVSGSWALGDAGVFDARDVVDESTASGLQAGNWILVGYFDAGDCNAVLAEEKLDNDWKTTTDLWGRSWSVRGGVYTFTNDLGRKPAVVMCRDNSDGRTLMLYRFLISEPETLGQDAVMADLRSAAVLERASRSYDAGRVENIATLRRPETRNRGKIAAARRVTLTESGFSLDLPDDGFVWLVKKGDGSDMLDRMAPFFPETTIEVAAVKGADCDDVFAALTGQSGNRPGREVRNLPDGWRAGPAFIVDGEVEAVACRPHDSDALVAGFFLGDERTDVAEFQPLLSALAKAWGAP